jgi:aspartyl-tRNA synthetase
LRRCTKCTADCKTYAIKAQTSKELEKLDEKQEERVLEIIASLKERQKRTIIRKIKNGEIEFDPKREVLVYAADGKDFELGDDVGSDDDGEERKSDGDD